MSPIELAANGLATLSILLAGRNSLHTWWTGILGCLLFAVVFLQARLYADVTLQVFFIVSSVAGWAQWRGGLAGSDRLAPRPVTRAGPRQMSLALAIGVLAAGLYGAVLHRYTDAYAPFVDSVVLSFSVIGQWLLMQRRVQAWPVWVIVNLVAAPLYASRGLDLTAALYVAYLVNALLSWRRWARLAPPAGPADARLAA